MITQLVNPLLFIIVSFCFYQCTSKSGVKYKLSSPTHYLVNVFVSNKLILSRYCKNYFLRSCKVVLKLVHTGSCTYI